MQTFWPVFASLVEDGLIVEPNTVFIGVFSTVGNLKFLGTFFCLFNLERIDQSIFSWALF